MNMPQAKQMLSHLHEIARLVHSIRDRTKDGASKVLLKRGEQPTIDDQLLQIHAQSIEVENLVYEELALLELVEEPCATQT